MVGLRRFAVLLGAMTALSSCAPVATQRQADREITDDSIPALAVPAEEFIVRRGDVEQTFELNGVVEPTQTTVITVPFEARVVESAPPRGTEVAVDEFVMLIEPTLSVRAAASELEAARAADRAGTAGTDEQRAQRVEAASHAAAALGLPVDDRADIPLPPTNQVLSPTTGIVVNNSPGSGSTVSPGEPVVVIGDPASMLVRATTTDIVIEQVDIGTPVTLMRADGQGQPVGATVESIETPASGTPALTVRVDEQSLEFDTRLTISVTGVTVPDALWVSPDAIRSGDDGEFLVVVNADGTRTRIDIETGIRTPTQVEILTDVVPGSTVLGP